MTRTGLIFLLIGFGIAAGAGLGLALRSGNPGSLSLWFVAGCGGAGACLATAAWRWRRWQERNMLIAAGGWLVAATFAGTTIWPMVGSFLLYVFYFALFSSRHERGRKASEP